MRCVECLLCNVTVVRRTRAMVRYTIGHGRVRSAVVALDQTNDGLNGELAPDRQIGVSTITGPRRIPIH